MSTTEAQKKFGHLVLKAIKEPISITKHSKEVFVIVPSNEFHRMERLARIGSTQESQNKNLLSFIGAGKQYSRFKSTEDVDQFISSNREVWNI